MGGDQDRRTTVSRRPSTTPYVPRLILEWSAETPDSESRELEGTLVFVDISGFTAMSERLAKKGRVGAEEVTEVLNGTFSELLRVAYEVDGSLLKFGGDALLLFFAGQNHIRRACHAAGHMRASIKKTGQIDTSAGKIRLDMSIGVHTGKFHFFLVGDSHRELMITSPEATKAVEMESAADAGEILVSKATAAHLDEDCLGPQKAGGRLLLVPCAATLQEIKPPPESEASSQFVPHAVREHILGGGEDPEHRQVTVAFVHFGGTDELLRKGDTAGVTKRLRELVTIIQQAVEENSICFLGTDIDKDGGKIILTAGAPQTTGNDEERMLRSVRAICDRSSGLGLRIGVHRGPVFAGVVGPPYRRTYTVMGDAVNVAARVMSQAKEGQILATKEVLDRSASLFEVEELEPFKVKGKAQKLVAFSIGKPAGTRREKLLAELPLIGRNEELEKLRAAIESTEIGQGSIVEIVGDAGLGKSRLVLEARLGTEHLQVVSAQCEQYESSTPYFPFRFPIRKAIKAEDPCDEAELITKLHAAISSEAPALLPWAPLIGIALDLDIPPTQEVEQLDEKFRSTRLRASVIELLTALFPSPTLFIFEDAHWMDEPSRELLADLAKGLEQKPWAIFVTTRPGNAEIAPITHAVQLRLEPLSTEQSIALARAASSDSLLPQQAEVLARRGGGHPLFLQALVAASRATTDLSELPETIESAISARIDELKPTDRTLLRHMAVWGREIDLNALPRVIDEVSLDDLGAALERLSDFVQVESTKATFRQALIRDAAYEGLPYRRRRAVHERIGRLIEERGDPKKEAELLSLHFDKAERYEESWRYSRIAAERARQKFAFSNVADFSRKAIVAGRRLKRPRDEMAFVWRELGHAFLRVGQYDEASRAFAKVLGMTSDVGSTGWLFYMQGQCKEMMGNLSQALRWYGRGLRLLESRAPLGQTKEPFTSPPPDYVEIPPRVRLIEARANVKRNQGHLREAIDLSHSAVAVATAVDDKRGLAIAYNLLYIAYTDLRDAERRKYGEMALAVAEEVGNRWLRATILNNLAVDSYWEGDWKRALSLYEASKDSFLSSGDLIWAAAVSNNIAEILSDQGKLGEAEQHFLDSLGTFKAARFEIPAETVRANLGRLAARAGNFEDAERLLSEAIESFSEKGSPTVETEARLAEVMVLKGESARALSALDEIQPGNDPILRAQVHRLQGWALAQSSRREESEESILTSLQLARSAGAAYEISLGLDALFHLTRSEETRKECASERQALFERLDIVSVPNIPLGSERERETAGESHPREEV